MRCAAPAILAVLLLAGAAPAVAFEPTTMFSRGAWIVSVEGGGGHQDNFSSGFESDLDLWYTGARVSHVLLDPVGPGPLYGTLDAGLEALYQGYRDGERAFWAGLGLVARWNFLSLGRLVPYVEGGAYAGGTDLEIREIDSPFAFLLYAGAGAAFLVTENTAVYAGYRLVHVSNGNTDSPNRGIEAHTGVVGISVRFR